MGYFPILIQYSESEELVLIKDSDDIISGKGFKVLETKVTKDSFKTGKDIEESSDTLPTYWIGSKAYRGKYLNKVFEKKFPVYNTLSKKYRVMGVTEVVDSQGLVKDTLVIYSLVGNLSEHVYSRSMSDFDQSFNSIPDSYFGIR